ncbi:methyltransferase domain-containing protein [Roseococcus sp. SYP-B2431]|uniref:methyltransferase domain-containing protein n=1 Tax=Roseococcus sp. SYP-B2431 TaxID=2496640 RepID=UPI00103FEB3E|nr:methyltransferase domain-containing protein [Roseococcus sp. SYP-B2431]TCH98323.1 methyltransferase domain-containing protein [Roseococcus sp. SYP-B2431]
MLRQRSRQPEWMDDPEAAGFDTALAELALINRLSLAARPVLGFLDRVAARQGGRPLSILDVGAGGGDLLARIAVWAQQRRIAVELTGLDVSPWAARHAMARGVPAKWITADAFAVEGSYDVVLCSLFAHHLDDAALARFLVWLEARSRVGWLISDLHRHWLPWGFIWGAFRLLRLHPMVVHDSTVSIARGFTRADWRRLLAEAQVEAQLRWAFPFRWQVSVVR